MGIFDVFTNKSAESTKEKNEQIEDECEVLESEVMEILDEIKTETSKNSLSINISSKKPALLESKFGGTPYLPQDMLPPENSKGEQLKLLAQIDCTELKSLLDFPHVGILQFWVLNDDIIGCDFANPNVQDNFRIIYHEEIDSSVSEEDVLKKILPPEDEDYFPIQGEFSLTFTEESAMMAVDDCGFDDIFSTKYKNRFHPKTIESFCEIGDDLYDELYQYHSGFGHKISGYPGFTQCDPRENSDDYLKYNTLLLQIDSDYDGETTNIIWGDSGICNFFISKDALKRCDFSDVIYNWDCY